MNIPRAAFRKSAAFHFSPAGRCSAPESDGDRPTMQGLNPYGYNLSSRAQVQVMGTEVFRKEVFRKYPGVVEQRNTDVLGVFWVRKFSTPFLLH